MKYIKNFMFVVFYIFVVAVSSLIIVKSFHIGAKKVYAYDYNTTAESMAIIEVNSGRIIASKDGNKQLPMASLTKIITAIVAIENNENLDKKLEIPKEAQGIEGSSIYLRTGEHLSMRELLFGLMLRSGNDAATAIAILTSGSVDEFIEKCNEFCKNIGLENTNLVTPSGLHDDNHYTTAEDLAKVTAYALKNDIFAEIVSTRFKRIDDELGKAGFRNLKNKNKFLAMMEGANGVKTGYTKKAGRCFVGSVYREEDNMQLACVLLNCGPMFDECRNLCAQALDEYKLYDLTNISEVKVKIGNDEISGKINDKLLYPLTKQEYEKLEIQIKPTIDNIGSIKIDEKIGELLIFVDKNLILCDNIYSLENHDNNANDSPIEKIIKNF